MNSRTPSHPPTTTDTAAQRASAPDSVELTLPEGSIGPPAGQGSPSSPPTVADDGDPHQDPDALRLRLKDALTYLDSTAQERVAALCLRAESIHSGRKRLSGAPEVSHAYQVALVVAGLKLDEATVSAAMLFHAVEDGLLDTEALAAIPQLPKDCARIAEATAGLSGRRFRRLEGDDKPQTKHRERMAQAQAESFKRMLLQVAADVRVLLLKLADRLCSMRSLRALPPERQRDMAVETLDIYAPIANRLGVHAIKSELEDLSFRYAEPEAYAELKRVLAMRRDARAELVSRFTRDVEKKLHEAGLNHFAVKGRAKHFYSMWRKMKRQGTGIEGLFDVHAVRVILDDVAACYQALGVIHGAWRFVPGRFKDYIGNPKPNGYQSLHTIVVLDGGERIEVQIRTREMHRVAEFGVAAHWAYKEQSKIDEEQARIVRDLRATLAGESVSAPASSTGDEGRRLIEQGAAMAMVPGGSPQDAAAIPAADVVPAGDAETDVQAATKPRKAAAKAVRKAAIFVFTPKGDMRELPEGATPLDFAYAVHTEVGAHCVGAKVNGRMVPLNTPLKTDDVVEVMTHPQAKPRAGWLNIATTPRALGKIRNALGQVTRAAERDRGRELVDRRLKAFRINANRAEKDGDLERAAREMGFSDLDSFFVEAAKKGDDPERIGTFYDELLRRLGAAVSVVLEGGGRASVSSRPTPAKGFPLPGRHSTQSGRPPPAAVLAVGPSSGGVVGGLASVGGPGAPTAATLAAASVAKWEAAATGAMPVPRDVLSGTSSDSGAAVGEVSTAAGDVMPSTTGSVARTAAPAVVIEGLQDTLIHIPQCCLPQPGDEVVGYISRGRGLVLHRADCPRLAELDAERQVSVRFNASPKGKAAAKGDKGKKRPGDGLSVHVETRDQPGMLAAVSNLFSDQGFNIQDARATTRDGKGILDFVLKGDPAGLPGVLERVRKLPGVTGARGG